MSILKNQNNTQNTLKSILIIIILAVLIRILLLTVIAGHPERGVNPDSESYIKPAISLSSTGIYPPDNGKRTPMYPLFIALIYFLFGENLVWIMVGQILLDAIAVYLTYVLGSRFLPRPAAILGALLMAVNIDSITYDFYYMTETLATLMTLAALLAWEKGFREEHRGWIVFGAILMGISVLTRPIALYFPVFLVICLLLKRERPLGKRVFDAAIYSAIFLVTLLPWMVRNYNTIGSPTISTISQYNLYYYNAASLEAHLRGVGEDQVRKEYIPLQEQRLAELGMENTFGNQARVQGMMAREVILSHPIQYIFVHLKSDLNSLLPDTNILELLGMASGGKGTLDVLNDQGLMAAIRHYFGGKTWLIAVLLPYMLMLGFIYFASLIGVIQLIKERHWSASILLIATCAYFLLIPGAPSVARFRVPIMPYLSLLAGLGTYTIYLLWQKRASRQANRRN